MSSALDTKISRRAALYVNECDGGGEGDTPNIDDVIACFNYLQSIRGHECVIPADNGQHTKCTARTAVVNGVDLVSQETQDRYSNGNLSLLRLCLTNDAESGDVAKGVQCIFTYCNNDV